MQHIFKCLYSLNPGHKNRGSKISWKKIVVKHTLIWLGQFKRCGHTGPSIIVKARWEWDVLHDSVQWRHQFELACTWCMWVSSSLLAFWPQVGPLNPQGEASLPQTLAPPIQIWLEVILCWRTPSLARVNCRMHLSKTRRNFGPWVACPIGQGCKKRRAYMDGSLNSEHSVQCTLYKGCSNWTFELST